MVDPPGATISDRSRRALPVFGRRSRPHPPAAGRLRSVRRRRQRACRYAPQPMDRRTLARRIHDTAHITGTFTLRSGAVSHEYFDKYLFEADPVLLHDIAEALAPRVPDDVDALAGLELGGVPIATMLSALTGRPARYVRKQAKPYGTCRLAEGGDIAGERLLIVEDVVTSGGAILDAVRALRDRGAHCERVVCVIDRESGGRENLAAEDLVLEALFTMSELKAAAAG
jgi:orotate phosphoribosyltransferase